MAGLVELRTLAVADIVVPLLFGGALLTASAAGLLGGPSPTMVWLGMSGFALAVAPSLDDLAAPVTAAAPVSARRRLAQRLLVPTLAIAVWGGFSAAVDGANSLSGARIFLTGAGLICVVVATCAALRRTGHHHPGAAVGSLALLAVICCVLFEPFVADLALLQAYDAQPTRGLWPCAIVISTLTMWWASGEPA